MPGVQQLLRFMLVGALSAGIATGCIVSDDPEPTQTPVIITPTPEPAGEQDATSTPAPTATLPTLPTTTPTATSAPTSTAAPTATQRPTEPPAPTATLPPRATPTATATDGSTGGIQIPDDPLTILPALSDLPTGMVIVDEGEAPIEDFSSDFEDEAAREQQLRAWGFLGAFFREVELPEDQIVDSANQPIAMIFRGMLLGSPENAQLELNSLVEEVVLVDPDVNFVEEVPIEPIGDLTRAIRASVTGTDGTTASVAFIGVTAGPFSMQFIAASGEQYDAMPDLIRAAQASLDYLGYVGTPALGAVLLETDFSTWPNDELESGRLFFGEDGFYHVLVDLGGGSFISAHSTDHEPFTDVAVSVDMRIVSGDPTSQGCVMTRIDQLEQLYDYALCVDGNGNVEALYEQFDADGNYTFEPLLPEGVTVAPPVDWTRLTIISRGEEFWFLINGELIDSVRHTGPPGGAVGVIVTHYAESPTAPAEFAFTNLVVQAVE